jgi:putative nucleotidyltransferase with HDIG domain
MPQHGSWLDRITRLIESEGFNLPVCDPVSLKLQKAISNKTEDIGEIESLILSDQALAADVLRAANSPFFCGLSSVRTIRTAIVRLGTQQMRRLIILITERAKYRARNPVLNGMLGDLWRHASTTALAAQWLSKRLCLTGIEEICFLGGLLHDIGKLVILKAADEIEKTESIELQPSADLLAEILQTEHCNLGYKMLQKWNIPEIYCQIARDHNMENAHSEDLPLLIVRLANEGSRKLHLGLYSDESPDLAQIPEANLLNISAEILEELQQMLENHITIAA